ncbi:MAG: hypothetical protein OEL77_09045 [Nitrosopumilus sp.]|nr:hypothetical protein [Nitrosopumilus sp.]MDH3386143.1 hypothetical protein [Nitrosopumilus sp.]
MKTSKTNLIFTTQRLFLSSFFIGLVGVSVSMWGASWDITSHLLRTPETFFTPSHMILYLGVGISLIGAILGLILILTKKEVQGYSFVFGTKLLIIGALVQIIAGPGDFYWHELFGIDGLLSPTHLALALGIIMVLIGSTIGFARINSEMNQKNKFLKIILPISFGIFWFSVMWLIFFFVLPISQGDTHNFNPNPYVAVVLGIAIIPFSFSLVFWFVSKTTNMFGAASAATFVFLTMNITSNILTSEKLLFYLPWFAAPIISAILADFILNKKPKSKFLQNHSVKISGAVLGSMFFMLCFPMLAMTFLDFYVFNDVFSYDVIHSSSDIIGNIWLMTMIPGAISGMVGMMVVHKRISYLM